MQPDETLCHTKWECKYPVVFIPKYRHKALYTELRQHLGDVFRSLAEQRVWGRIWQLRYYIESIQSPVE